MTFYEQIKQEFKNLQGLNVKVFNDVTTYLMQARALEEDDLVLVVKTGTASTSKVNGLLMTNYPLLIQGFCNQNARAEVLEKLNAFVKSKNGKVYPIIIDGDTCYYTLGLDEPSITSTNQVVGTKTGEITCCVLTITGQSLVSDESMEYETISIQEPMGQPRPIPRIVNVVDNYNIQYQVINKKSQKKDDMTYVSAGRAWQISFINKQDSAFCEWLDLFIDQRKRTKLVLFFGSKSYNVVLVQVASSHANGDVQTRVITFNEVN